MAESFLLFDSEQVDAPVSDLSICPAGTRETCRHPRNLPATAAAQRYLVALLRAEVKRDDDE